MLLGAGDGHDAFLCFLWATGKRGSPERGSPGECNSARPPRGVHERQAGLRACEEEPGSWKASPSHAGDQAQWYRRFARLPLRGQHRPCPALLEGL
ncbi:hypothetical protein DW66_3141 [Pseudomonas putida]|nr:hypothetical protein DW66_3141 [Pseudomonas putida]AJG13292.1 hypothetical protein RK21_01784 [Pseudomonas plecoglossicida]